MARIRTIKPGFFRSDDVTPLSYRARLTWVGLWTYVDDDGRGKDNARIIKGEIWTLEDDVTHIEVEEDLEELHRHDRISRYEVDGKRYLVINKWLEHQVISRPTPSKLPEPAEHNMLTHAALTESSVSDPVVDTAGRGRGKGSGSGSGTGNEEEEREGPQSWALTPQLIDPANFDDFWNAWGRKIAKADAEKAWAKAIRIADPLQIVDAARALWESPWKGDPQFIPYPGKWLNGKRWNDPPPQPPQAEQPRPTAAQRNLATVAHFEQQQMEIEQ